MMMRRGGWYDNDNDNYQQQSFDNEQGFDRQQQGMGTGTIVSISCLCLVILAVAGFFAYKKWGPKQETASPDAVFSNLSTTEAPAEVPTAAEGGKVSGVSMQSLKHPGWYPTVDGVLRAGSKNKYEMHPCAAQGGNGGFAIRFKNKWLTAAPNGGRVFWADDKVEPNCCWQAVDKCKASGYVMLKNIGTQRYLSTEYKTLFANSKTSKDGDKAFCFGGMGSGGGGGGGEKQPVKPVAGGDKKVGGRATALESVARKGMTIASDASWTARIKAGKPSAYLNQPQICRVSGVTYYTISDGKGRRLIDGGNGSVYWSASSRDSTCWQVLPNNGCGSNASLVRSSASGRYLRVDGTAVKTGTKPTTTDYCWRV